MLRRRLGLRIFLKKEVRVTPAPTWCRKTTHTTRTKGRLPSSLSRLLPSRRRRLQMLKELASRAVMGHFERDCPNRADRKKKACNSSGSKTVNTVTASNAVFSVFQSTGRWLDTGTNVHMCADISMHSSYQVARVSSVLMRNGSHASVHGVGIVDLKFT
jgi:hypothetical protein